MVDKGANGGPGFCADSMMLACEPSDESLQAASGNCKHGSPKVVVKFNF